MKIHALLPWLCRCDDCRRRRKPEEHSRKAVQPVRWMVQSDQLKVTGENLMLQLKTGQHALVKIDPEDDANDIVTIDGVVKFVSTDPSVFTAVPDASGLGCDVIATAGGEGKKAQLTAVFDADRGAGVHEIATSLDVTVDFPEATHGVFVVGAAEPVTAPAPVPAPTPTPAPPAPTP